MRLTADVTPSASVLLVTSRKIREFSGITRMHSRVVDLSSSEDEDYSEDSGASPHPRSLPPSRHRSFNSLHDRRIIGAKKTPPSFGGSLLSSETL